MNIVRVAGRRRQTGDYSLLSDIEYDFDSKRGDETERGTRGIYKGSTATVRLRPDGRCVEIEPKTLPEAPEGLPELFDPKTKADLERIFADAEPERQASFRRLLARARVVLPAKVEKGESTSAPVGIDLDRAVFSTVFSDEVKRAMDGRISFDVTAEPADEVERGYVFRKLRLSGSAKASVPTRISRRST